MGFPNVKMSGGLYSGSLRKTLLYAKEIINFYDNEEYKYYCKKNVIFAKNK